MNPPPRIELSRVRSTSAARVARRLSRGERGPRPVFEARGGKAEGKKAL